MENFTILFSWVNEEVRENDFYFKGIELDRTPSSNFNPKDYTGYKRAIPIVCSNEIGIGDTVFILNMKNLVKSLGKVLSIDRKKGTAEIEVLNHIEFNGRVITTWHFSQVVTERIRDCFYPILELNVDDKCSLLEDCQEISRDQLDFKTICSKCSIEIRQPEKCATHDDDCGKNKKQQLAFIK
jgi:hypothetical protein